MNITSSKIRFYWEILIKVVGANQPKIKTRTIKENEAHTSTCRNKGYGYNSEWADNEDNAEARACCK